MTHTFQTPIMPSLSALLMTKGIVMCVDCFSCVSGLSGLEVHILAGAQIDSCGCFLDYLIYYGMSDSNAPPARWADVYQHKA